MAISVESVGEGDCLVWTPIVHVKVNLSHSEISKFLLKLTWDSPDSLANRPAANARKSTMKLSGQTTAVTIADW